MIERSADLMSSLEPAVWPKPHVGSDRDDRAGRVQPPEVARIACDDVVAAQPGENHDRGIDNVGGFGGAAEFSAVAGEPVIEKDNLDFVGPQKPRQCDLNAAIPPGLPTTPEGTLNLKRCARARSSKAISRLSPRSRAIKAPASRVIPARAAAACVLPIRSPPARACHVVRSDREGASGGSRAFPVPPGRWQYSPKPNLLFRRGLPGGLSQVDPSAS